MSATIIGLLILGLPALLLGAVIMWRRNRPVYFFFLALLAVGLGYLSTTPTPSEIALMVLGDGLAGLAPAQ